MARYSPIGSRAGADYAVTQMFFRVEDCLRLRDRVVAAGCDTPVIPAILPVMDPRRIVRFAELSGITFPDDLARRLDAAGGGEEGRRTGVDFAVAMAEKLLTEGAPGPRYITLNRSSPTSEIHRALLGSALTAHA